MYLDPYCLIAHFLCEKKKKKDIGHRFFDSYHHHPLSYSVFPPPFLILLRSFFSITHPFSVLCLAPSMDLYAGPPPGLTRPKTSPPPPPNTSSPNPLAPPHPNVASPVPRRATSVPWASSLAAGLFPATFPIFPAPLQVPHGLLPSDAAVQPAVALHNNYQITDLGAGLPTPDISDPWHRAHARVCAHAATPCAACSVALFCCTCRALRLTPGPPPVSPSGFTGASQCTRPVSPALFRPDVGNGTPPPGFDSHGDDCNDDAYIRAFAESDTCDNSSCPRGANEPATYSITVEQFDEASEETYERIFRACSACNRSCRKSFMGHRVKTRVFDNSAREALAARSKHASSRTSSAVDICPAHKLDSASLIPEPMLAQPNLTTSRRASPPSAPRRTVPGSTSYAIEHPVNPIPSPKVSTAPLPGTSPDTDIISALQDSLRELNERPPTPVGFVASTHVKHDARCLHQVDKCDTCCNGLLCCFCKSLFRPAVARHLKCMNCMHVAYVCCTTCFCCQCSKPWAPSDTSSPARHPARRFYGGAGSTQASSPEPDIWTPSPRSSPDEIDDLTARANLPLPASCSESDASRAPSRASSVDVPVNVAATPLPTPDYSSLSDDLIDGLIHPSFPDRAILDTNDKRHFLGRGDLSVTSLKLYARQIFTETSHWITAGHFLVDIFQGATIKGSRNDFRRFVILVGTQLGYGDLAQSMSESLDVNRKMADEYMRLRDVATNWKQKAKANSKDA